jgi:hypothetical protein
LSTRLGRHCSRGGGIAAGVARQGRQCPHCPRR